MEIGYALNPTYWGKGYIPEAVNEVLRHCFCDLELDLVWCGHADFNQNSKRVIEKTGFKYRFIKELHQHLLNRNINTLFYAITYSDYFRNQK